MVDPGPPRAVTQTTAARERRNITYGTKAVLRMSVGTGGVPAGTPVSPLGGRRIDVQVLGRLGWRTNHSVKTDAFGKAETRMRLSLNRRVRARFQGEPGLLPSSSASLQVGVRPVVTAAASVAGKRVRVTGTVRPKKAAAILTLKRRTSGGRARARVTADREAAWRQPARKPARHAACGLPVAAVGGGRHAQPVRALGRRRVPRR